MNIVIRFFTVVSVFVYSPVLHAHCQVPCGIYDDHSRVHTMLEDAQTIHKACVMINELASLEDAHSRQQLARWVSTKEDHATKIITMISEYYLTQRIKPTQNDYLERLNLHHAVILAAVGVKQNTTKQNADILTNSIRVLMRFYPHV